MIGHITWFIEGPPVGSRLVALSVKPYRRRRRRRAGKEEEEKDKTGLAPEVGMVPGMGKHSFGSPKCA